MVMIAMYIPKVEEEKKKGKREKGGEKEVSVFW